MLDPRSGFAKAQMAELPKSYGNSLLAHLCLWKSAALDYKRPDSNLRALILIPFLHSEQKNAVVQRKCLLIIEYLQIIKMHSVSEEKKLNDSHYFMHRNRLARENASEGKQKCVRYTSFKGSDIWWTDLIRFKIQICE